MPVACGFLDEGARCDEPAVAAALTRVGLVPVCEGHAEGRTLEQIEYRED